MLAEHHAAAARGDLAAAAAILDERDRIAHEAAIIRTSVERARTVARVRLALAGCLVGLDLDPVHPITSTHTGNLKLPGGITIALRREA